ncbi:MAG: peptidoglycan DD-metalloendopeptidase family protein [Candidatus Moranbacteria bacterium]|nr:peptidoglycan DD-metalloendopeptidase family protein [Candidatus Moranbacteria bacterium]
MVKKQNPHTNKHLIRTSAVFLAVFGLLFFTSSKDRTYGATDCDSANDKVKCLEKERKNTQELIDIKNKTQLTIKNQLSYIETQQQKNQVELLKTKEKAQDLAQQVADLEREIKDKESLLKYQQLVLGGLIQSYYEYNQGGLLNIVLINQDFSDIFSQSDRIEQSSGRVSEVLKTIRETRAELQDEYDDLKDKKQESEELKSELEDKNLDLQYSENQKQNLLGQTQAEIAKYKELLASIDNEINELEEGLSNSVNMANLPPDKDGYFTWPVNPHIQTQGYGKTSFAKTSGMYKNNFHNGLDFGISYKNVFAARGGKVVGSGDNGKYAYGRWIAIDHGDGLVTLYGHLSKKDVSRGEKVKEGQKIGVSGNTGNSTGPHIHFSVFASETFKTVESSYVNGLMIPTGAPVNPKKYL